MAELSSKRAAVRNYKEWRNSILSLREEERRQRNLLKQQQVELVEEWQVSTAACGVHMQVSCHVTCSTPLPVG